MKCLKLFNKNALIRPIRAGTLELFDAVRVVKRRKFEGYKGMAIKNSLYQISTSSLSKLGSVLFTAIIARLLIPEVFGLYALALSTITLFAYFTDWGAGPTMVRYMSIELEKKKGNPLGYYIYLRNFKITLTLLGVFALAGSAYFLANFYYQKPIFLALMGGGIYILAINLQTFFNYVNQAENNFRAGLIREIIYQSSRLIIIPILILLMLRYSTDTLLFLIFAGLAFCYLISGIYLAIISKKYKGRPLAREQKNEVFKAVILLSSTTFSAAFFGYVDIILLGRLIQSEYIAYYQVAISLIGSASAILSIASVLLPIFSRVDSEKTRRILKRTLLVTFVIGVLATIFTIIFGKYIILLAYGSNYVSSTPLLRLFSVILILDPLIAVYSTLYISKGRPATLAKLLFLSAIVNLLLLYLLITWFMNYSQGLAIIGAGIAIILSRLVYLISMMAIDTRIGIIFKNIFTYRKQ